MTFKMNKLLIALLPLLFSFCHEEEQYVPEYQKISETTTHFYNLPDSIDITFKGDTLFIINTIGEWESLTSKLYCPEINGLDTTDFNNRSILLHLEKNYYSIDDIKAVLYKSNKKSSYYKIDFSYYQKGDYLPYPKKRATAIIPPTKIDSDSQIEVWIGVFYMLEE